MRYAHAGRSGDYADILSSCYWMARLGCPEHCYVEEIAGLDIYIVAITNGSLSPSFGHAICAEYLGGGYNVFNNWKFFQYENTNIRPGDWQMPYELGRQDTKVQIKKVTGILDCAHYVGDLIVTFLIDEYGNVTVG